MYKPLFAGSCLFTLLFCQCTFAQIRAQRQVLSVGPKIGVNISNFRGDDVSRNGAQAGLVVGAVLTYSVVNNFAISVEALYAQKGARFTNEPVGQNEEIDYNRRINYVEIPVLARYYLNTDGFFRPNVFVGPAFGFMLSAKEVNRKMNDESLSDVDISDAVNPVDVGLAFGAGLNFQVAERRRILVDARYTLGISDITEADNNVSSTAFTLTVGTSFGFGKRYKK